jgi:hypothetical protein
MAGFRELLRTNRNYRWTWIGQVVSECFSTAWTGAAS